MREIEREVGERKRGVGGEETQRDGQRKVAERQRERERER